MACTDVWDAFAVATEDLDKEVFKRASHQNVWLNIIQRGEYPHNVGLTRTVFTAGRQEPASDEETWPAVTLADGSNAGACSTTYHDAYTGYNADTYSPEQYGLKGPVICKDELIFSHNVEDFLRIYLNALSIRARRSWENRYQTLFINFSRKGVARADFALTAAEHNMTLDIATSALTQEMLDNTAYELINSGATDPDSQGWITLGENGPVFPLMIGLEMSNQLATNNADLRDDIRWADSGKGTKGAMLLQAIGANRTIKNFRHVPVLFPPRYTYNGTAYVRVNTWTGSAGTKGTVYSLSTAYKAAPYEGAIVMSPWVFKSEIVRPVNSAAGLSWSPTNSMGEWQFVTGAEKWDTDCPDPLQKYGRHFAEFKHAAKPIFPEYGVTLIYKRCPLSNFATVYCT
jgi:hypothetical protein